MIGINLFRATLRMSTPLLLTALGGVWTQQTGILFIGQEGAMLISAFFAVLGNHYFMSWTMGLLCGIAAGVAFNMIFALLCALLRANIWVVGMTLNILADSLSVLLMKSLFNVKGGFRSSQMVRVPSVDLAFLPPILQEWLSGYSLIIWIALICLAVFWFVDSRTTFGMRLKATGENEEALQASGVSVVGIRFRALAINGIMVGLAGAFLSTSYLLSFVRGMSAERGWIAVAAVIFGGGSFKWTMLGVLIFGLAQAVGIELQSLGMQSHFALMIPYLLVIIALVVKGWRRSNRTQ